MPKAMATISQIRSPRLTSAPSPQPLSQWIEHLKRTRLTAKKARRVQRQRHAATQNRLTEAERLISRIIEGADVVAQGAVPDAGGAYPAVYLLLTLHTAYFNNLAISGSELEDVEASGDREYSTGYKDLEEDTCDDEPSLGAGPVYPPSMVDLEEASHGFGAKDQAIITAARARYKQPPQPEQCGVWTYTPPDPEVERVGAWILERRKGGAK
jgi:hypothetical protein